MIEAALNQLLSGNAAIAAAVADRIYPVKLPQDVVFPALSFFRAATRTAHIYQGGAGISGAVFQISVWADDSQEQGYELTATIGELIRLALDGFRGSVADVEIRGIFLRTYHDLYEDETKIFHRPMDFEIWHNETRILAA